MRFVIIIALLLVSTGAEARKDISGLVRSINSQLARYLRPSGLCSGPEQMATLYGRGDGFLGRRTACGDRLNSTSLTVAHRSLPCGTIVSLSNPRNGRSVTATVTDRGPFTIASWDLAPATGDALGMRASEYLCVGGSLLGTTLPSGRKSRRANPAARPEVESSIINR